MTTARNIFELQQIDAEIKQKQSNVDVIKLKLASQEEYVKAERELKDAEIHLTDITKRKVENELEVNKLQKNIEQINNKLYGGKITNSKELVSLEQEAKIFMNNLQQKENNLLNMMSEEEKTQDYIKIKKEQLENICSKQRLEQVHLLKAKGELEKSLTELNLQRQKIVGVIESHVLKLYDGLSSKRGHAVVRVEQGRCQGCRITLATSEWQKAKSGAVIQCNSCGMILYLG
jgi:predicted  nucleic acid-binding Zn-ribbon protein